MKYKGIVIGGIVGAIIGLLMILKDYPEPFVTIAFYIFGVAIVGILLGWALFLINKKTKEWKIGAIIGFAMGLFGYFSFGVKPQTFLIKPALSIVSIADKIFGFVPAEWGEEGMLFIAVFGAPIIYAVLGVLIGFIIGKIRRKNDK